MANNVISMSAEKPVPALKSRIIKTQPIKWRELQFIQKENFKEWVSSGDKKLQQSLLKYQFADPFKVWENDNILYCLDGYHRHKDLEKISASGIEVPELLPATFIDCYDIKEAAELVLVYSSAYARITQQGLFNFLDDYDIDFEAMKLSIDISNIDIEEFEFNFLNDKKADTEIIAQSLQERFIIPPFSIFDSRQGYWQDRKKQWHSLGFDSQETREDIELVAKSGQSTAIYELRNKMRDQLGRDPEWDEILAMAKKKGMHTYEGASIFDPVLAEICYKWFCPEGGQILDPFAGGSVRGIVASILGYSYFGIDLRTDQVEANRKQAINVGQAEFMPTWLVGDSNKVLDEMNKQFDFIFSCPPYHDLEKYSDDPADLSNMNYHEFCKIYRNIILKSLSKLKPNRFACFVVGDIRDEKGFYRDFIGETIRSFTSQPLNDGILVRLYNEIILINVAGSLPIRVGRQFEAGRKVGKMHQNVLVFYKGDPKKIKEEFPEIKVVEYLQELNYQPNIALSIIE